MSALATCGPVVAPEQLTLFINEAKLDLDACCEAVLALRRQRRELYSDLDRFEAVLVMHMVERKIRRLKYKDVVFIAQRRKIIGTPSERRKWRELNPEHALDSWHQPFGITIQYHPDVPAWLQGR